MPQTPNNAPSTSKNYVLVNQSFWLRCISTRLNTRWQQNVRLLNHHHTKNNDDDCLKHQLVHKNNAP